MRAGQYLAAKEALEKALSQAPNDKQTLAATGDVFMYFQKEDEAVALLERAWGHADAEVLWLKLAQYADSRQKMAQKLGVADEKGADLSKRIHALWPDAIWMPAAGIKISAVLIAKNEEARLERCLSALKSHVDEIVLVDTGSTDRTVEIAESYGAKIGRFDWIDDFAAARNESLKLATGDWALWIDCDEVVDEKSWGGIREAVTRPHFGGYFIRIVNFTDEAETNSYTHAPVRLFQNLPTVTFTGRVHEQVTPSLDALNLPCAQLQNATIWHYGYVPSEMAAKNKVERTLHLLKKQIEEEPNEAFHWFNLANAYSVGGNFDECVDAAKKCLQLMEPGNSYASLTYQLLAGSHNAQGRYQEAQVACGDASTYGCFSILNQFELAHALYGLRRFEEALEAIDACFDMPWTEDMTGDYGIKTHKSHVLKAQILTELGRYPKAMELVDAALKVDPNFGLAWLAKGTIHDKLGKSDYAFAAFKHAFGDPVFGWACRKAAGMSAARWKQYDRAADLLAQVWREKPAAKDAWSEWAMSLEALGDPHACLTAYQEFTKFHDPNADVLINWGRRLEEVGDVEGALAKFRKAAESDSKNPNAKFNLGDAYYRASRFLEAAETYQAALQLDANSSNGWFVLGNAFAQLGVLAGAITAYEQALKLEPGHTGAYHNLALVKEMAA